MTFKLPTIYPITDRQISGLTHLEQARRLVNGGARLIQLREKVGSSREFFDAAVQTIEYANAHRVSIIINDRVDIAIAANAAGVHLGQNDMPPEKARALLGDKSIIGYSTHTLEQARLAATLPVTYIAFGPVFATTTKADPDAVVGLDGVRRVREAIGDIPLVAIGGINVDSIEDVLSAGADSVAMISAVIGNAANITATLLDLNERFVR
ncbi:MAG: thiamine phosphate synthase [Pyrinomonadaceae bacterium]|nr:thiamine phosphate synthase [Pyrinomonadaceae bacterium]MBP9110009.1 thiamine phosphate synthase [Pyrinomonadaceae bacterium]